MYHFAIVCYIIQSFTIVKREREKNNLLLELINRCCNINQQHVFYAGQNTVSQSQNASSKRSQKRWYRSPVASTEYR